MATLDSNGLTCAGDIAAVTHLEQAVKGGRHWYPALLEAIGLWTSAGETHDGCVYRYLIAGEAFDWLLLAGRLYDATDGLLPAGEVSALLFHSRPPFKLSREEVKGLMGNIKYRQCLNFFYGVVAEQTLVLAVEEEIRKERRVMGYLTHPDVAGEAYHRVYGATREDLLKSFRREKGYPQTRSLNLTVLQEFTYWLFQYRLGNSDKTRVASDTKKGLAWLSAMGYTPPW